MVLCNCSEAEVMSGLFFAFFFGVLPVTWCSFLYAVIYRALLLNKQIISFYHRP